MMWNLDGTHVVDGLAVCDRCGQPRQVRFEDVRPVGFVGKSPYGGILPVTCDCWDARAARDAVKAMTRVDMPYVAFRGCGCVAAAKRISATYSRTVPSNFVSWVDEGRRAAMLTSRYVYKAIRNRTMEMTRKPHIAVADGRDFAEVARQERMRFALLIPIESLGAVA